MINSLRSSRRCLLLAVACGLGMIALASSQARAGTLQILMSDGTKTYDILDHGPLDTNAGINGISVQGGTIGNPGLLVFADYVVGGLSASTNNPGQDNPVGAFMRVTGDITRTTSGAAPQLTITVTDTDYVLPAGDKTLSSSVSGTFTNAPLTDSQTFTSSFNPSNTPFAINLTSGTATFTSTGTVNPNSHSADSPIVPVGSTGIYGLTNQTVLTLSAPGSEIGFSGSTKVLTVIPEPTSLAIMLLALPVVMLGWLRHLKPR